MIIQPDSETLLAVILGAALATAGGFTERQIERNFQRAEKERNAKEKRRGSSIFGPPKPVAG